jgi:hypothetical protein
MSDIPAVQMGGEHGISGMDKIVAFDQSRCLMTFCSRRVRNARQERMGNIPG